MTMSMRLELMGFGTTSINYEIQERIKIVFISFHYTTVYNNIV